MITLFADKEKNLDRAALVLRLVLGAFFIAHGYQKVFGMGVSNVAGFFGTLGVPMATLAGPFIAYLELLGGLAILLGGFTRVFALLLACDMLGAIILVHGKNGFFAPKGIELVFGYFGLALALVFLGAGAYSIDAMLARRGAPTP
jgi:putative oxidoreductase